MSGDDFEQHSRNSREINRYTNFEPVSGEIQLLSNQQSAQRVRMVSEINQSAAISDLSNIAHAENLNSGLSNRVLGQRARRARERMEREAAEQIQMAVRSNRSAGGQDESPNRRLSNRVLGQRARRDRERREREAAEVMQQENHDLSTARNPGRVREIAEVYSNASAGNLSSAAAASADEVIIEAARENRPLSNRVLGQRARRARERNEHAAVEQSLAENAVLSVRQSAQRARRAAEINRRITAENISATNCTFDRPVLSIGRYL